MPVSVFYSNVEPKDCEEIIQTHIIEGNKVERLLCKDIDGTKVNSLDELNFYKKQKRIALKNCGVINPEDIDYINAHGTSTHLNDLTETKAIKTVLGDESKNVMISSTKGNTGHLLGAAGAVEAIVCVKAIENQVVPPTINYKEKDEECDLDIVQNELRKSKLDVVMSNSLGFGGHNGCVVFRKFC